MKSAAIICEYNPFHNGHRLQIKQARELFPEKCLIAVMSGNTVQRGDFSIFDKYERAKQAVLNGMDLVVELPFPFSCSAGPQFAKAGVFIASELEADTLIFGSECGDTSLLEKCSRHLASPEFEDALLKNVRSAPGISFIAHRESVYREMFGQSLPSGSNDILGIEYIKSINSLGSTLQPLAMKRTENYTASECRQALRSGNYKEISRLIPGDIPPMQSIGRGLEGISTFILGYLRISEPSAKSNGIRNALIACARSASGYTDFIDSLPTKTYTLARLRREIIASLFDVDDSERNALPTYTVLLGANARGVKYLSELRKTSLFPVLTKHSEASKYRISDTAQFKKAVKADSISALTFAFPRYPMYFREPFIQK